MRALIILALALALAAALYVLLRYWLAERRRRRGGGWRLEERSDGEMIRLMAVRPGDEELLLGAVPIGASEFESRLADKRAAARDKVTALNERA